MNIFKSIISKSKNFILIILRKFNTRLNVLEPLIIPRSEHNISRKKISRQVLKVLYTLKDHGFKSYLVGGVVRDLILEKTPKDFDVATNAYPEKIKKLFKHCYIVGKRFPLVHVCFNKNVVEVATFRSKHYGQHSKEGMILRDNVYGNIEQDASRRDFTINALYYNIVDYSVIDYVGGLKDLHSGQIRLIGDPVTRYREDPVRMLRAIRFAAKLGFNIHPDTEKPIYELGNLLLNISSARLYEEYVKLFFTGHPIESFKLLKKYRLFDVLFPGLNLLPYNSQKRMECFILEGLNSLQELERKHIIAKDLQPGYVIAIFLWSILVKIAKEFMLHKQTSEYLCYKEAASQILTQQNKIINISRKLTIFIKDIWLFQYKLSKNSGKASKKINQIIESNKFSVAFDFLSLRALAGDKRAQKTYRWWKNFLASKNNNQDIIKQSK
jgi:poly(A) polymerase